MTSITTTSSPSDHTEHGQAEPGHGEHAEAPVVHTTAGAVRGVWRPGSAAFLGIPFAEAPVGERRFGAPVPHAPWPGIRDAVEFGATPQRRALQEVTIIPEPSIAGASTLNLNVFTPRPGDESAGLPVVVWIHGGGFVAGSPASPWYDGAAFNRDGVVTVNVSYRLGFDGFGFIEDAPLNRGVLDWILALEWVRDNIRAFGGDPARVTIAGQSAGGGAVLTLLAVPSAAHLFAGAISLSGPESSIALGEAQALGYRVAELGGVLPTRAGLSTLDESTLLELQNRVAALFAEPDTGGADDRAARADFDADLGAVVAADARASDGAPPQRSLEPNSLEPNSPEPNPLDAIARFATTGLRWVPIIDGELVPTTVEQAFANGSMAGKSVMLGCTDNEFNMILTAQAQALAAIAPVVALSAFGLPDGRAEAYVDAHSGLDTANMFGQFVTDTIFRSHTRQLGEALAAAGTPGWLYRFSWPTPTMGSAAHCIDVPFFFDCLDSERVDALVGANPPRSLASDVHGAAVRFIAAADPGWPRYEAGERSVRQFDAESKVLPDGFGDVAGFSAERVS
ncbi:carboxylesterase/lipase family protein [Subtercola lobariae]|uniref:Carboxylic ester hydrolase n=1 Tax=Subtercola lobariae TaxID=1588641 RepID=A0A917BDW1_9MICO|nr:carboxylesterase family protein [Subtercola lobariae]GGF39303.1 hypothetical protein GCM10011399_35240 [Subtercola lobariae]